MDQLERFSEDEKGLLQVFRQYGRDGRAITVLSLAALSPLRGNKPRLAAAIASLKEKCLIVPCGADALTGTPQGYRLRVPMPARRPPHGTAGTA